MRFSRADPTLQQRRRAGPWTLYLVAALALIGWCAADMVEPPRRADTPTQAPAQPDSLPISPLIAVIIAIVFVTAAWVAAEAWMAASQADAVARALTGGDPARASALVTRYGCGGCHIIPGLSAADGKVGPPLVGIQRQVFIAGVLPNTADNLISWIVQPRAYSPGSAMPVTGISEAEARDVAAWLYAH